MLKPLTIIFLLGAIGGLPGNVQAQPASQAQARTEFIAMNRTKARKVKRARARTAAPALQAAPPHAVWTGPDPTKGPGIERLHKLQREGRCVIDEGYGRFTFCSDR